MLSYILTVFFLAALLYAPIWIWTTAKKNSETMKLSSVVSKKRTKSMFNYKKPCWSEENITGWEDTETYQVNTMKGG